jgi:hypothetical protein
MVRIAGRDWFDHYTARLSAAAKPKRAKRAVSMIITPQESVGAVLTVKISTAGEVVLLCKMGPGSVTCKAPTGTVLR